MQELTCQLVCNGCQYYPCGVLGDLNREILKVSIQLNNDANSIIADMNSIELPDTSAILKIFKDYTTTYPTAEIKNLTNLASVLGLPYNNSKERLAALGLGVIGKTAWLIDSSNNFKNYRLLYKSLDKDYEKTKAALSGAYGKIFAVTTLPKLFTLVSTTGSPLSLEEISSAVGYSVVAEDTLTLFKLVNNELKYVTYVYTEEFLGINKSIEDSAALGGVTEDQVSISLFALSTDLNSENINKLRSLGLTEDQLSTLEGVDLDIDDTVLKYLTEAITLTNTLSISEKNIQTAKSLINKSISLVNFDYYSLDADLLKLNLKNTDKEIELALQETYIDGIDINASDSSIISLIKEIGEIESGTHRISNEMLSVVKDLQKEKILKLYVIKALLEASVPKSDATLIARELVELKVLFISKIVKKVTPKITYKSYDSGIGLITELINYNRTFLINQKFNAVIEDPFLAINDKAVAEPLKAAYNAAFKVIDEYNSKINQTRKDIEAITSFGTSFTGEGSFANSYLKCSAGITINLPSILQDLVSLLGKLLNSYNNFLLAVGEIFETISKLLVCLMKCIKSAIDNTSALLPYCTLRTVEISESVNSLLTYSELFEQTVIKNVVSTNNIRFALFELSESAKSASRDCNCNPLQGIFDSLSFNTGL